jgi:hypothetical protein
MGVVAPADPVLLPKIVVQEHAHAFPTAKVDHVEMTVVVTILVVVVLPVQIV